MRQIKDPNLARLLIQLRFNPSRQRLKQLTSAEKLLAIIEKDKEYPFDFICFRITGYRPKELIEYPRIKGEQLAEDLTIFISRLSSQVAEPVSQQDQKIYTVEQLAAELGVSTKTINRWRKQGLGARKFIFDDSKKRFGFPQSSVDKFLKENPSQAAKAKGFRRLTKQQQQQIVKEAVSLSARTSLSRYQIIKQIATSTGRAHETIRYTLLNLERTHPKNSLSDSPPGVISPDASAELYQLFQQGTDAKELTERFRRSKSSVYRIINRRRTQELLAKKIEFVANDEFLRQNAKENILSRPIDTDEIIVDSVPAEYEDAVQLAADECPVEAIVIE